MVRSKRTVRSPLHDLLKEQERRIHLLTILGWDLVHAIENACWQDELERPNLYGPTLHMNEAKEVWRESMKEPN